MWNCLLTSDDLETNCKHKQLFWQRKLQTSATCVSHHSLPAKWCYKAPFHEDLSCPWTLRVSFLRYPKHEKNMETPACVHSHQFVRNWCCFFLLVRCLNTKFVGFLMIARRPHKKWYVNDMFSLGNAWSVQYAIMAEVGEPAKLRCHSPNNARVGGLRYGEIYNYIHPIFHLCAYISCSFIFYSMQLGT